MSTAAKTTPAIASRAAPARFTGFIPWNRLSKSKLLHGERQKLGTTNYAPQCFSQYESKLMLNQNFNKF
jgi:hypothetical protein